MTQSLFYGNEPVNYAIALGTLLALVVLVTLGARFGPLVNTLRRRRSRNRATALECYLLDQLERTLVPLAYVAALFIAFSTLHLAPAARHVLDMVGIAVLVWAVVRGAVGLFRFAIESYITRNTERGLSSANLRAFVPFVNVIAWGFALVFVLDAWGFHVTAIVAGLGIGGVAVALAAQSILRD